MKTLLLSALMLSTAALAAAPAFAQDKLPAGTVKNVVLVHGAFANETSWDNVAAFLTAKGYHVTEVKNPLTSLGDDVAATKAALAQQDGPTVLVGHSWGGFVIGEAGDDPKVTALVYVSAFGPDKGESITALSAGSQPSPGVQAIRPDDKGFLTIDPAQYPTVFAPDLPKAEAEALAKTQLPINHTAFDEKAVIAAWHVKPSWFAISGKDLVLDPAAQELFAKRMGAKVTTIEGGHDSLIAFPDKVAAVIEAAAAGK